MSDEEKERNEAAETKEPEKESEKEPVTLLSLIEAHDTDGLHRYFDAKEPIDIAQEAEELSDEELAKLPDMLTDDEMAALMEESEDEERIRIAHMLDNRRLLLAFHYMQKDDIVDILGDFPTGRQKDVINLMKTDDRKIITDLLKYPEDSAGGIMTTGYLVLKEERTVEQGLERIREVGPKTEYIDTIYIIDAHRKVVGQIGLRDLLSSPRSTFIKNIMDRHVISVTPETDQKRAARLVSRYDLKALPVVSRGQMLGIITLDDIIDVIVDEADEDILQMGGVNKEESLDTPDVGVGEAAAAVAADQPADGFSGVRSCQSFREHHLPGCRTFGHHDNHQRHGRKTPARRRCPLSCGICQRRTSTGRLSGMTSGRN
jgi:magnesium transporter